MPRFERERRMRPSAEHDLLEMNRRKSRRASRRGADSDTPREPLRPWRLLLRLLIALVIVGFALHSIRAALRPHCLAWLTQREIQHLNVRLQSAERVRDGLTWENQYTASPEGKRSLSRYFGFVEQGEVAVMLPEQDKPDTSTAEAAEVTPTLWERFMLLVCRMCGAQPDTIG